MLLVLQVLCTLHLFQWKTLCKIIFCIFKYLVALKKKKVKKKLSLVNKKSMAYF